MKKRVTFYFDGFNFYNGLKDSIKKDKAWKKCYWMDFVKFSNQFLDGNYELIKVKYFTADPLNSGKQKRQSALFRVNKLLNPDIFEVIKGKYYRKPINCSYCHNVFEISEEKRTDVNICLHLISDCLSNKTDVMVLVSADSDLVTPVSFIKENYPNKKIRVYFPPERSSYDLFNTMDRKVVYLKNNTGKFDKSLLSDDITMPDGRIVSIPSEWKVTT